MIKHSLKALIAVASIASASNLFAESAKCLDLANSVKIVVAEDRSNVLAHVASFIGESESCACEIVKAAIVASDASAQLVGDITETAILTAPSKMRIIGQCAVAVAPDAFDEVQAVVYKYSSNATTQTAETAETESSYASYDNTYEASDYSSKGDSGEKGDAVAADPSFGNNAPFRQNPLNLIGNNGLAGNGGGAAGGPSAITGIIDPIQIQVPSIDPIPVDIPVTPPPVATP